MDADSITKAKKGRVYMPFINIYFYLKFMVCYLSMEKYKTNWLKKR
jgi:hypothetical protein